MKHTHAEGLRREFRSRSADRDAWQGDTRREVPDGDEGRLGALLYTEWQVKQRKEGPMKLLLGFAVISVTWCAIAGSVISWDAGKTSGAWSDGANWVGGVAPGELSANCHNEIAPTVTTKPRQLPQ